MTINEIESRTGLDRGTVRYYEAQGLIRPLREANGYRNYSEDDLEKPLKVKLLRALNFSVEDIRAMDADSADFQGRLRARVRSLEARQEDLEDAKRVLGLMIDGGERYETLDPGRYLAALEDRTPRLTPPPVPSPVPEPAQARPELAGPWHRFFARSLDEALWSLVFVFLLEHVFRTPYLGSGLQRFLSVVFTIGATLAVEPLMLHLFGATPGKWVLGLEVTDSFSGGRLSYSRAFRRTREVLFWGQGWYIPIFGLARNVLNYRAAQREEALRWEGGSSVTVRTWAPWRGWAYGGCWAAALALMMLSLNASLLPANRGALTPEAFSENVNRYIEFNLVRQNVDFPWQLRPDGTWVSTAQERGLNTVFVYPDVTPFEPGSVELRTENGVVTGLHYSQTRQSVNGGGETFYFQLMIRTLTCALIGADRDAARGLTPFARIESQTLLNGFESFTTSFGPWTVTCKTEPEGAQYLGERYLWLGEDVVEYGVELTITRDQQG